MNSDLIWLISAIGVDGLIIGANIIELTLLTRCWRRKSRPVEILIFSLCVSDLLCGTAAFVEDSIQLSSILHIKNTDQTLVQAYFFDSLFTFSILSSNLHVISIAVKKLIAEVVPGLLGKLDSKNNKAVNVFAVWVLAAVMAAMMSILPDILARKAILGSSDVQRAYGVVFLSACVIVFLVYLFLFINLIKNEKRQRIFIKTLVPSEKVSKSRARRNAYMCLLLGLSFVACVLPYSLGLLDERLYHPLWNILIVVNHLFNPMVYFFRTLIDERQTKSDKKLLIDGNVLEIGTFNDVYDRTQDFEL